MAETANYKLYVEDDNQTHFIDWRTKMDSATDSNMTKIDDALGDKAEHSVSVAVTLSASAWSGSDPATCTLTVDGLTAEQNGTIGLAQNITDEQFNAACDGMFRISGQSDGALTISAYGTVPEVDIPVVVILMD